MRAKTILTVLFLLSLGVAGFVVYSAMPRKPEAPAPQAARPQILVAAIPLAPGTLLRDQDVTWQPIDRAPEPGEFARPVATGIAIARAPGDSTTCRKSRSPGLTISPRRIGPPLAIAVRAAAPSIAPRSAAP